MEVSVQASSGPSGNAAHSTTTGSNTLQHASLSLPITATATHATLVTEKPEQSNHYSTQHVVDENAFRRQVRLNTGRLKRFLSFVGPGYLIAVGYMDPGNWATDLAAGSKFGYSLLTVIFFSNIAAILLQVLAIKLGVVTGMDLARMCREEFKPWLNWTLYIICELAIIATDLAEVIGSAIALDLLFGVPLAAGVVIMGLDVLILLLAYRQNGTLKSVRIFEWLIILMVTTVGICFSVELVYVGAPVADVLRGYIPEAALFTEPERIYLAMGIVGATVMPHNLYLHSSIVQARAFLPTQEEAPNYDTSLEGRANAITTTSTTERRRRPGYDTFNSIRTVIRFTVLDCLFALSLALFINSAILVVGAGGFHNHVPDDGTDGDPADLYDAYYLIGRYLGTAAAVIYAVALFIAGQSSTLTATLTGQIVMEGFVGMAIRPWLRRIVTRSCAIVPALIVAIIGGRSGITNLLVVSQVALSVQLPFAMIPLIWFTSSKRIMRPVALNKENGKVAIPALSPATTSINVIESGIGQHHHHHCIDVGCTSRNEMDPEATIICRLIHSSDSRTQPLENENDQHHSRKNIHMEPPASPHNIRKETALMSITTKVYGSIAKSTTNKPSSVDDIDDGVHFANSLPIIVIGGAIVVLLIGLNIYMLIGNSW